jgi:hypothetical protein
MQLQGPTIGIPYLRHYFLCRRHMRSMLKALDAAHYEVMLKCAFVSVYETDGRSYIYGKVVLGGNGGRKCTGKHCEHPCRKALPNAYIVTLRRLKWFDVLAHYARLMDKPRRG